MHTYIEILVGKYLSYKFFTRIISDDEKPEIDKYSNTIHFCWRILADVNNIEDT